MMSTDEAFDATTVRLPRELRKRVAVAVIDGRFESMNEAVRLGLESLLGSQDGAPGVFSPAAEVSPAEQTIQGDGSLIPEPSKAEVIGSLQAQMAMDVAKRRESRSDRTPGVDPGALDRVMAEHDSTGEPCDEILARHDAQADCAHKWVSSSFGKPVCSECGLVKS